MRTALLTDILVEIAVYSKTYQAVLSSAENLGGLRWDKVRRS